MRVILALVTLLLVSGCVTTYKTLRATAVTVDQARAYYAEQVVLGKVSVEKQVEIDKAIANYQTAMKVAITAARFNYNKATPEEVEKLATNILLLIGKVAQ